MLWFVAKLPASFVLLAQMQTQLSQVAVRAT